MNSYDFKQQHNLQLGKLPRLEAIQEKFISTFATSMREIFMREANVTLSYAQVVRYGDYISGLTPPLDVNLVYIMPDRKPAIVVLEAALLYVLVDQYFGGEGSFRGRQEAMSLSRTERRTAQHVVERVCRDLGRVWSSVAGISFEPAESLTSPHYLRVFGVNDMVLETSIRIGFDDCLGEMQIVLPYDLIEANREALVGELEPQRDIDEGWHTGLSREVEAANVRVSGLIDGVKLSVDELLQLQPGDVIPFSMPDRLTVRVQDIPLFSGAFGRVEDHHAIQIIESCGSTEAGTQDIRKQA